ncbi:single-stranded-DNA-specific exonuclease RecJ [Bacillus mobilis]|uniref:single-stranded-DNA-specific exonuclease RecJ n=1 Tax=Bacillus mobilis TaxID=2026190 RepID=UPI0021D078BC|nr:DHH family phosphoesterase [Bacillus mobilis]MCU5193462.1 DHH family phosphoesterase [Bacillus mobilis]
MNKWIAASHPLNQHLNKKWIYYLSRQFNVTPILIYNLYIQGFTNQDQLEKYFHPNISHLHDPFLMNEMDQAVKRIMKAITNKEKIVIFGDYDCDGITSSSLLFATLKKLGAYVYTYLPLRENGYGLSVAFIQRLRDDIGLIITVDNGSSAYPAINLAKERNIDVIVTDHHEVLGTRPNCYSFINPKRKDNSYPFSDLSGAGVALKLTQAILQKANIPWEKYVFEHLELAALGTIADLMPLCGENRTICSLGLRKMNYNPHYVLKMLFNLLKIKKVDSNILSFQIAPILNAIGRIGDPNIVANMLKQPGATIQDVKKLISINQQRKVLTQNQFLTAQQQIQKSQYHLDKIIVLYGDYHYGLIGLLASRVAEFYKKPTIVISQKGVGSARSVNGTSFSIIKVIDACRSYLKKYGGHTCAAGFSIKNELIHIEQFRKAIQIAAMKQELHNPLIRYSSQLSIQEITWDFSSICKPLSL